MDVYPNIVTGNEKTIVSHHTSSIYPLSMPTLSLNSNKETPSNKKILKIRVNILNSCAQVHFSEENIQHLGRGMVCKGQEQCVRCQSPKVWRVVRHRGSEIQLSGKTNGVGSTAWSQHLSRTRSQGHPWISKWSGTGGYGAWGIMGTGDGDGMWSQGLNKTRRASTQVKLWWQR